MMSFFVGNHKYKFGYTIKRLIGKINERDLEGMEMERIGSDWKQTSSIFKKI